MKAAVTGGAGFIGSHLVERLLRDGHEVVVLDNFATGTMENLEGASKNPLLSINQVDVTSEHDVESALAGVDWVFHLAALADIVPSIQHPLKYHKSNVDGTVAVLEAARKANVKKFVYAASSSCYGIPDQYPTPESAAIRVMYPYACTKNIGEQYVLHWNQVYGLPCVSLRLFNVYGPRSRTSGSYGAVFGVFLAQKLAGKPLTVVGNGSQTRDFTFVSDVVEAFILAAQSNAQGEFFNVGSGKPHSVSYLASLLGGDVVYIPKRPGEPDCTFADIQKIGNLLGWRPAVSIERGVEIMLENIQQWATAPVWDQESISDATQDWFKYLGEPSIDHPDRKMPGMVNE